MQMNGSATVKITKPITGTRGCGKEIAIRVIRCKPATGGRLTEVFYVIDAARVACASFRRGKKKAGCRQSGRAGTEWGGIGEEQR